MTLASTMTNEKSPTFGVGDRFKRARHTSKFSIFNVFSDDTAARFLHYQNVF